MTHRSVVTGRGEGGSAASAGGRGLSSLHGEDV